MSRNNEPRCSNCKSFIELEDYDEIGDKIVCYRCNSVLEIKSLDPPVLKVIKKNEDDEYMYDGEYFDDYDEDGDEDLSSNDW